jgi:hypothetical protein
VEPNRELAGWIAGILADQRASRALVLDGATARVARRLKQRGMAVRAADTWQSHHLWNGALVPDGPARIGEAQAAQWMRLRKESEVAGRFFAWANEVFSPEEAVWLGIWRANILESGLPFRLQALGSVVVMRTMAYWLAWNRSEIGHKPLPPAAVFRHYVDETNREITQSGNDHQAVFLPPGLEPDPGDAELLFWVVGSGAGIMALDPRLTYWERWILGDPAAELPRSRADGIGPLLEKMVDVPVWALAYGGNPPDRLAMHGGHRPLCPTSEDVGQRLFSAILARRPDATRHEIQVPYPHPRGSAIMTEGLILASKAA